MKRRKTIQLKKPVLDKPTLTEWGRVGKWAVTNRDINTNKHYQYHNVPKGTRVFVLAHDSQDKDFYVVEIRERGFKVDPKHPKRMYKAHLEFEMQPRVAVAKYAYKDDAKRTCWNTDQHFEYVQGDKFTILGKSPTRDSGQWLHAIKVSKEDRIPKDILLWQGLVWDNDGKRVSFDTMREDTSNDAIAAAKLAKEWAEADKLVEQELRKQEEEDAKMARQLAAELNESGAAMGGSSSGASAGAAMGGSSSGASGGAAMGEAATSASTHVKSECVFCMERDSTHAIMPCGHMCLCKACVPLVHECPVCRGPKENAVRIWT